MGFVINIINLENIVNWLLLNIKTFDIAILLFFKRLRQQKNLAKKWGGRGRSCRPCSAGPMYM